MASLFVDQRVRSGMFRGAGVGGGVRYTGHSYGDTANTLSFSVNMRNIANKRLVATCTAVSACFYGQGCSLIMRLEYRR
ncbi:hypothetical protein ACMAUO_05790 [Gluconacetobacter sp. Hr-1-5]|uniref:hypothetical protein n=1 Tax=Gluconacetobacter sp. Hr-1-5 TaxID=3395370 RepID=UPI003B51E655